MIHGWWHTVSHNDKCLHVGAEDIGAPHLLAASSGNKIWLLGRSWTSHAALGLAAAALALATTAARTRAPGGTGARAANLERDAGVSSCVEVNAGRTDPTVVEPNSASAASRGYTHLASSRTPAVIISFMLEARVVGHKSGGEGE